MPTNWLLLHGGALGDLVLAVQLLLRIPAVRETGNLSLICRADLSGLNGANPSLLRRSLDGIGSHWLHKIDDMPPPAVLADAVAGSFVVNMLSETDSAVHSRLMQLRPARLLSIDPRPRSNDRSHIVDQWQAELERQGAAFESCTRKLAFAAQIGVPESLRDRGRALLADCNLPRIGPVLVHPGSGSRQKNWPLSGFMAVADRLRGHGVPVVFLLGEVEKERCSESDLARVRESFCVISTSSTAELAAILSVGRLLLGNDSGPSHLAALLGRPTLTLFGPTDASIWRPLGPGGDVLMGSVLEDEGWGLTVEQVSAAVLEAYGLK